MAQDFGSGDAPFGASDTPISSSPPSFGDGDVAFGATDTPVEEKSFRRKVVETVGDAYLWASGKKQEAKQLFTDVVGMAVDTPVFLGATAAGGAAALQHEGMEHIASITGKPRPAGTAGGAASDVSEAVMQKYGGVVRKLAERIGVVPSAKEGEPASAVGSVMQSFGKATEAVQHGVLEATGSEQAADASKWLGDYLALPAGAKALHGAYNAIKLPVAEHVDGSTHVESWKEQLAKDKQTQGAKLKETAFRNKETGEVHKTGPKHPEKIKEDTKDTHDQGFVDVDGNFLDREQALLRARSTKQISEDHLLEKPDEGLHSGDLRKAGNKQFDFGYKLEDEPVSNDIPHPSSIRDAQHFDEAGMKVLEEHGPEAAEKFAKEVITTLRNHDLGVPKTHEELADAFYKLGKNKEADGVELTQALKAAEKDGVTPDMKNRWREHAETGKELAQDEQALFNKYYKPLAEERRALMDKVQKKGWALPVELDESLTGSNVARKTIPKQLTPYEQMKEAIAGRSKGGFDANIEAKPGAAKERGLFVAEHPSGRRTVVQAEGDKLYQWVKGSKKPFADMPEKGLKAGDTVGSHTIKEATVNELEQHSPYRYNKDSQAVLHERIQELRDFVRSKQLVENLKNSDLFKEYGHKIDPKTETPEGFRTLKNTDKVPEFAGMAFEPKTAEIIEDFAKNWTPNALTNISGALIKNMMLNPIPHMLNESWHLYNARGLTGWVTPAGIARFVKTGVPAIKEVMSQGAEFRSMLRDGASLLSADTRNSLVQDSFMKKGMQEFMQTPEAKDLAIKLGMKPAELYNAMSRKSNIAMWVTRDAMYMQLVKEKMLKGLSQKEAIKETERHMPNYRLPTRVAESIIGEKLSRGLSETLQNPNVTVFSRYHYGMLKSLGETAKDLTGAKGAKAFKEGADTAAAISVALAVLYPLQDMLAQAITGNEDATVRRAGPYHPMTAIYEIAQGEKDPQALLAAVFTFNPALLAGAQLIADRKLYNGQPIYNPTDSAGDIAGDVADYLVGQAPQVSTALKVSNEDRGGGMSQWLAQQADIKSPTPEEVAFKEKMQERKLMGSELRELREDADMSIKEYKNATPRERKIMTEIAKAKARERLGE